MCQVCVADSALAVSSCRKDSCAAFVRGHEIVWEDAPPPKVPHHRRSRRRSTAKLMINPAAFGLRGPMAKVFVRARGKSSEGQPARYQIRLPHEGWPKEWTRTAKGRDLASSMSLYGFDVKWQHVPAPMQRWVLGKSPSKPTEEELLAEYERDNRTRKRKRAAWEKAHPKEAEAQRRRKDAMIRRWNAKGHLRRVLLSRQVKAAIVRPARRVRATAGAA